MHYQLMQWVHQLLKYAYAFEIINETYAECFFCFVHETGIEV